jgi:potassium/hydrogen antiporter
VSEVSDFGQVVLIVGVAFTLALFSSRLTERLRVPAPALFLLGAAAASDLYAPLARELSVRDVERLGVVALVAILFEGGMHVGWRRFRASLGAITAVGVMGTFVTAGIMTLAVHWLFGLSWTLAALVGAAVAPTDPAVMFSVLGRREVAGRSGTILLGESGMNDPVGIALMIAVVTAATSDDASLAGAAGEFLLEMGAGLAVGLAGAALLVPFVRKVALPNESLYPLRTLAAALVIYGAASVAHGSGFLAVFVTGIALGDVRAPYKASIERFHSSLANLAEIVVFVALGLTVDLGFVWNSGRWLDGILIALVLIAVARPLAVGPLLLPLRLHAGEKAFVVASGLKGAVPILLGTFGLLAGVDGGRDVYAIIFVVVAVSVTLQGALIPVIAPLLGVRMRDVEPEPWDLSIRVRHEPRGVERYVVSDGSHACGHAIRDLPLSERTWVSLVLRDGRPMRARGSTVLEPGDELLVLTESGDREALRRLFEGPRSTRRASAVEQA